ncbi:hypothetical protein [Natronomonas amylolytica]|uniref:hypothetical protein n=1 Tax=Natronomonas amylolytica TaxID=3108498 RepID=UPI00300ABEE3
MSLDIGAAFREGANRTVAKNGLLLTVGFFVIGVVVAVLYQTLLVEGLESLLEAFRGLPPEQANIGQEEYNRQINTMETQLEMVRETSPLALDIPLGVAAAGLVVVALLSETVSIVAVRVFATDETDAIPSNVVTDNVLLATLNGFIGKIVVWGLIWLGLVFFVLPGIFFAVVFYFLRQEIALRDKNFVSAMADSWRLTKGNRIEVFAVGLVLLIVSQLNAVVSPLSAVVPRIAVSLLTALLGAALAVFGAAVVTRLYVQLREAEEAEKATEDPYDAALGPDDLE